MYVVFMTVSLAINYVTNACDNLFIILTNSASKRFSFPNFHSNDISSTTLSTINKVKVWRIHWTLCCCIVLLKIGVNNRQHSKFGVTEGLVVT